MQQDVRDDRKDDQSQDEFAATERIVISLLECRLDLSAEIAVEHDGDDRRDYQRFAHLASDEPASRQNRVRKTIGEVVEKIAEARLLSLGPRDDSVERI